MSNPVAPDNVDVVFPISDNPVVLDAGAEKTGFNDTSQHWDNSSVNCIDARPINRRLMEEFLFEFDNDIDHDPTTGDTG